MIAISYDIFSRIKDTWIEFPIEMPINDFFFSLIRVIVFFVMFAPSVLNAQASCLDRCCGILNVSTFGRRVNSTTPMKEKKNRLFDVCAQPEFFLFHENISLMSHDYHRTHTNNFKYI